MALTTVEGHVRGVMKEAAQEAQVDTLRKRLKRMTKQQKIALAELKNWQKSGQEAGDEDPVLPPEEDIIVSWCDTQEYTSPLSNSQEGAECKKDEEEEVYARIGEECPQAFLKEEECT